MARHSQPSSHSLIMVCDSRDDFSPRDVENSSLRPPWIIDVSAAWHASPGDKITWPFTPQPFCVPTSRGALEIFQHRLISKKPNRQNNSRSAGQMGGPHAEIEIISACHCLSLYPMPHTILTERGPCWIVDGRLTTARPGAIDMRANNMLHTPGWNLSGQRTHGRIFILLQHRLLV